MISPVLRGAVGSLERSGLADLSYLTGLELDEVQRQVRSSSAADLGRSPWPSPLVTTHPTPALFMALRYEAFVAGGRGLTGADHATAPSAARKATRRICGSLMTHQQ